MENEQILFTYLVHHTSKLKKLLEPIKQEMFSDLEYRQFDKELIKSAKWVIVCHLVTECKIGVDNVLQFMDNVNMEELLK